MRVLVVGGSGMLGSDMVSELKELGEVRAPTHAEFDVTDPNSVAQLPAGAFGKIDWVINCAAYTAVDKAETDVRAATELNAIAPGYLARAAASCGAKFVHVSTDFVFDGDANEPYTEEAPTNPLGVYGRTKREGERGVIDAHPQAIVVRTSWLFGPQGGSFPKTMIRAWEAGKSLRVVSDQIGCPTYTAHLASTIRHMIHRNLFPGLYHASGTEAISWHAFAVRAIEEWKRLTDSKREIGVAAIEGAEWPTAASRPAYSVLSNEKLRSLDIPPMPPLNDALRDFCSRLQLEDPKVGT